MHWALVIKTRKKYNYYYFYDHFVDASTNRRVGSLWVAMVVLSMQSTDGDNDRTYTSYVSPLATREHGSPCRPSWRARQS